MTRNTQSAADQFAGLGLAEADYTPAMTLAVKQRWSNLPIDRKVDDLRAAVAAVKAVETPTVEILEAQGFEGDAKVEAARLKRNATVNAWRERNQLQAALDAREARYAAMRAQRKVADVMADAS
jgi:hypothetical protein